jgi:asparagine synthase (glutamine-hydrolysing)
MGLAAPISAIAAYDARPLGPAPAGGWSAPGVLLAGGGGVVLLDTDIVVVADARLENRTQLVRKLGLVTGAPDAALIAAAYRRWGHDAPAHLEGPFAFALWDAGARRLFCARDLMGVRPLCYRMARGCVHVAQSPAALAEHGSALRPEAIADFLYGRVLDAEGTWFDDVLRVPAGHSLVFERGTLRLQRHSRISPAPADPGREPAETLRALLDSAVMQAAAGEDGRVGVLLSGGLDSSSLACLLRDQRRRAGAPPLPAFAMMFREPARSNERRHAEAVIATGGFAPQVLDLDGYAPFEDFETQLAATGGPTLAPNLACMRQVVAAAADRGVTVLLDGHGGDEVVGHGYGLLDELAGRGAWLSLLREARGAADNYGRSRWVLTRRVAARAQRRDARRVARLLAPFDREARATAGPPLSHLLSRDLLQESRLAERLRAFARPEAATTEQAQHRAVLADPLQPYAFEVHAAFYASQGVAARYPFWNRRVVEFCLGLPATEKLAKGWSRLVLRRAMRGVVPDSVLQRRDKMDFTVHLARGLVRHHHERMMDLLASAASPLAAYVDLATASTAYATIAAEPDRATGRTVQMVWRAAALGIWLESRASAQAQLSTQPGEVAA